MILSHILSAPISRDTIVEQTFGRWNQHNTQPADTGFQEFCASTNLFPCDNSCLTRDQVSFRMVHSKSGLSIIRVIES